MSIQTRLKHAWDAFRNRDPTRYYNDYSHGSGSSRNPNQTSLIVANEKSIIASIYNRMAIDVASISFRHVRLDQNGRYKEDIDSSINQRLNLSPNIDQSPRAFIQDLVLSLFDQGYVAILPAEANYDITETLSVNVTEIRRAYIREWFPDRVRLEAYDSEDGTMKELIMPKKVTPIIENPLYMVMNGQNSTLQRLVQKLSILDAIDRASGSGKLDIIIQLPYGIRNDMQQKRAEDRRKDIEMQLTGSKYGIAYIDSSERITQLNRPVENNLLTQIEYLRSELFSQLGLTPGIFDGTATEQEQTNYNNRTIEPIAAAIASAIKVKWLTQTAITQGQSIEYFREPFKLVPVSQLAELADKMIRNEILTPNEFRSILGYKPSEDPKANELRNPNIAESKQTIEQRTDLETNQNGSKEETK